MKDKIDYDLVRDSIKQDITFKRFLLDHGYDIGANGKLKGECPSCGSGSGKGNGIASCAFHVYETMGKCFSCGDSFDVIAFVMQVDKLDYLEAIRCIGNEYGMISLRYVERKKFLLRVGSKVSVEVDDLGNVTQAYKNKYESFLSKSDMDNREKELLSKKQIGHHNKRMLSYIEDMDSDRTMDTIASKMFTRSELDMYLDCYNFSDKTKCFHELIGIRNKNRSSEIVSEQRKLMGVYDG